MAGLNTRVSMMMIATLRLVSSASTGRERTLRHWILKFAFFEFEKGLFIKLHEIWSSWQLVETDHDLLVLERHICSTMGVLRNLAVVNVVKFIVDVVWVIIIRSKSGPRVVLAIATILALVEKLRLQVGTNLGRLIIRARKVTLMALAIFIRRHRICRTYSGSVLERIFSKESLCRISTHYRTFTGKCYIQCLLVMFPQHLSLKLNIVEVAIYVDAIVEFFFIKFIWVSSSHASWSFWQWPLFSYGEHGVEATLAIFFISFRMWLTKGRLFEMRREDAIFLQFFVILQYVSNHLIYQWLSPFGRGVVNTLLRGPSLNDKRMPRLDHISRWTTIISFRDLPALLIINRYLILTLIKTLKNIILDFLLDFTVIHTDLINVQWPWLLSNCLFLWLLLLIHCLIVVSINILLMIYCVYS